MPGAVVNRTWRTRPVDYPELIPLALTALLAAWALAAALLGKRRGEE